MPTHDYWHSLVMSNLYNLLEVGHIVSWVADTLDVDSFCLVVDVLLEVFGSVSVHKACCDSEARKSHLELIVSSSIQVGGADNVVASMS